MAKSKNAFAVQGRHIYARASYLYQAATYLSSAHHGSDVTDQPAASESRSPYHENAVKATQNLSRQNLSEMRAVCLKSQIRQSPAMKQTICKFCDTLLVEGKTCQSSVENHSKRSEKPWADVLVIKCSTCGSEKRYPVSSQRQKRVPFRKKQSLHEPNSIESVNTDAEMQDTLPAT